MAVRVSCPHCQQAYNVSEDKLGKSTSCKRCNERFTLAMAAPVEQSQQPPVSAPEPQPPGFLSRLKSGIKSGVEDLKRKVEEANERQLAARAEADAKSYAHPSVAVMPSVKFITGPIDLKPNTGLYFDVHEGDIVLLKLRAEITLKQKCDPVFRFPLASVKHMEIETAERMTLGRVGAGLLLAGPLGAVFGGFGFKKRDRLLRIDFDDAGMEASIILGGGNVQAVNNKIMTARRDGVRHGAAEGDAASSSETGRSCGGWICSKKAFIGVGRDLHWIPQGDVMGPFESQVESLAPDESLDEGEKILIKRTSEDGYQVYGWNKAGRPVSVQTTSRKDAEGVKREVEFGLR